MIDCVNGGSVPGPEDPDDPEHHKAAYAAAGVLR